MAHVKTMTCHYGEDISLRVDVSVSLLCTGMFEALTAG